MQPLGAYRRHFRAAYGLSPCPCSFEVTHPSSLRRQSEDSLGLSVNSEKRDRSFCVSHDQNHGVFPIHMALLWVLAARSTAMAAGFDCAKPSNPREKLICGDQILSDLERRLLCLYAPARNNILGKAQAAYVSRFLA
jgi:hypothetical protein